LLKNEKENILKFFVRMDKEAAIQKCTDVFFPIIHQSPALHEWKLIPPGGTPNGQCGRLDPNDLGHFFC